jgi:hypothetical protein
MTVQILTPTGYRDISTCNVGDEVSAFDATGAPVVNTIETLQWVDADTFRDWQNPRVLVNGEERFGAHTVLTRSGVKRIDALVIGDAVSENGGEFEVFSIDILDAVPSFDFYRVNGSWTLFREQSIWRNGANVCHARDLVVGDVIHDDADHDVTITSIETVEDNSLVWYRFAISGDHSYIIDGLTVHNASRFWVGGTGTWDSSTTTNWAATTGGTGGQSVPGSADDVTFDGASGGGTVTINFGGTVSINSITMGAFTGTWDNSVNNNNFTIAGGGFSGSGTGTRTIKLGTATYTLTGIAGAGGGWAFTTVNNLTYSGSSANIVFTGTTAQRVFQGGGLSHGHVTFGASATGGNGNNQYLISGANTFASLTITGPNFIMFPHSVTTTITAAISWNGSSTAAIGIVSGTEGSTATIAVAAGSTASYAAFRDVTFTGSPTATNSFDLLNTVGITITGPSGGGTGSGPSFSATIF